MQFHDMGTPTINYIQETISKLVSTKEQRLKVSPCPSLSNSAILLIRPAVSPRRDLGGNCAGGGTLGFGWAEQVPRCTGPHRQPDSLFCTDQAQTCNSPATGPQALALCYIGVLLCRTHWWTAAVLLISPLNGSAKSAMRTTLRQ